MCVNRCVCVYVLHVCSERGNQFAGIHGRKKKKKKKALGGGGKSLCLLCHGFKTIPFSLFLQRADNKGSTVV